MRPLNLEVIMKNILRLSSSFTKEQGKNLFKESAIKDLKSKSIDGTYHIYGRVLNDNKSNTYSTHIKINTATNKIIDTKCSCETFEENRRQIRNYVCKHIIATSYTFYNLAKKRINNKEPNKKEEKIDSKRFLNLDIMIKCIINDNIPSYQCEFRIGNIGTHLITDLKDFIEKDELKIPLRFNQAFTYNPSKDEFLKEDRKIITFIKENKHKIRG